MIVEPGDWLVGKPLSELRLSDEGILILGIRSSDGEFHGTPRGTDVIHVGETLIIYGDLEDIAELDRRRAGRSGDKEHRQAVREQEEYEEQQRQEREQEAQSSPPQE